MEMLDFYKGFIGSTRYNTVNEAGHLLRESGEGELKPIRMLEKAVVLPTKEFLANPDWDNTIAFHPMSESIARGESEIIHLCTSLVQASVYDWYCELGKILLLVAADQSRQTKLTPTQQKLLSPLAKADGTTLDTFNKIIAKTTLVYNSGEDRRLVSLLLRRGGTLNGQSVARLFVAKFPMYDAICKLEGVKDAKDRKVFGVPLRAADVAVLKALHHVILPGEVDAYNYGTNSSLAPYFTALVNGYVKIANQFNAIIRPFSKQFKHLKAIDTTWDRGEELSGFKNQIPSMPYNEGVNPAGAEDKSIQQQPSQVSVPTPVYQQQAPTQLPVQQQVQPTTQPVQQAPVTQSQPQPAQQAPSSLPTAPSKGPLNWNAIQPQQPMYQQPQMPGYSQPGFQQPMMPQMPGVGYPQQPMIGMPGMMMHNGLPLMSNGMPQPPMPQSGSQQPMGMPGFQQQPMMPPQVTHSGIPNNFGPQMPMMGAPGMMQPMGMPGMGYPPQVMPGMIQPQMPGFQQQLGMPGANGFVMQQPNNSPFTFVK